jgi:hypothetical protein
MPYPFEISFQELKANLDIFATSVFSLLQSEFLVLPKGEGFLDYPAFERGYEVLKRRTSEFQTVNEK